MKFRMIVSTSRKMQTAVRHLSYLLLLISSISLFVSCQREPLEVYYAGKADVVINVDWMSKFGEKPSGMTVIFAKDGDDITYTDVTNSVDQYETMLEPGDYKMLIFNHSFNEFGSIRFAQTKSFNNIYAFAQQLQRTTDFWDINTSYRREPEHIGCAIDSFTILPEMTGGKPRFISYKDRNNIPTEFEGITLNETVETMETEMTIRVRVLGIKYMSTVIGSISGMADGFLLTQAWRRPQTCNHLLENWTVSDITYENNDTTKSVGYITTTIRTYGLPHGRELDSQRDSTSNILSLCFTLVDDKKHVFRYPVGKMIKYRTIEAESRRAGEESQEAGYFAKTDVTLELDLVVDAPFYDDDEVPNLPYAQPSGSGAFDAEVSPWGDDEIVDIPM